MATLPHYCTDPEVTWGNGRAYRLVVHYWDLQSVHGFRCYDNIHVCKLIALYTASAYSAESEMSASACTRCIVLSSYWRRTVDDARSSCQRRRSIETRSKTGTTCLQSSYIGPSSRRLHDSLQLRVAAPRPRSPPLQCDTTSPVLVSWSLTSLFSTNMAISETETKSRISGGVLGLLPGPAVLEVRSWWGWKMCMCSYRSVRRPHLAQHPGPH